MHVSSFTNPSNVELIDAYYQRWKTAPESVDASWRAFFEGFELAGVRPGNGGNGHGGGLFNAPDAALTITDSWIIGNRAKAGKAGSGGTDGESAGGGIYNNMGAIDIDARTHVFANFAELFRNCFGC